MTTYAMPMCGVCAQRPATPQRRRWSCAAFPDGIPREILLSQADHRLRYRGDHGIVFTPRDADAARYAAQIMTPLSALEHDMSDAGDDIASDDASDEKEDRADHA